MSVDWFGYAFAKYLSNYIFIFSILVHFHLYLSEPSNVTFNSTKTNISNILNITSTFMPVTTTAFETSFSYFTTDAIPNDTSTIDVTLHFNNSHFIQPELLNNLTRTFRTVLSQALIQNNVTSGLDDVLYLQPTLDMNRTNITNINLYLDWKIILLIDNDKDIITILYLYLSSTKFIEDFNIHLTVNIELIKTDKLEIHRRDEISTTALDMNTTISLGKDEYILPEHLREYMLLYVVLFCIISIILLCFVCWFCTGKCFRNTTTNRYTVTENTNKIENKIESKPSVKKIHLNSSTVEVNETNNTNKYAEIDNNDKEYMMKAFDDDEALHENYYKENSDSKGSDEIQLIQSVKAKESLTLTQRLKVQNAFEED